MTRLSRQSSARRGVRLDLWSPSSGALSIESPDAFHEEEGSLFHHRSLSVELRRCLRLFLHAFQVAYGFRAGVSICARIVGLLRREPKRLLSLDAIFGEENLVMRTESVRQGLFVGGLVAGTELVAALISKWRRRDDGWSIAVGGACGGVALLLQSRPTRRTLALYALTRLLQCVYRSAKRRGVVQPLKHGDALIFMASSAQIMYSWVMRPDTLPPSFFSFITKTGPIHKTVLETVRRCNRGDPLDVNALEVFLRARLPPGSNDEIERRLAAVKNGIVPCSVLHPEQPACTLQLLHTFGDAIRKVLPLYTSLTVVPVLLFKLKKVLRSPVHYVVALSGGLARSLLFIGSFVSLYMGSACMLRCCWPTFNHRSVYFLFGLISSLSIFIERKARRSELALYTLPRGADSLFQLLVDRRFLSAVPFGDVLLFCCAMSGLMFFYRHDRESMPPLLARICDFLFKERGLMHRDRSFYSPASP